MQHFYDGQIRRYITQVVRLFSSFSYKTNDGTLRQIPVTYGDLTRQVANIIRDNSENKIPSAPRIAVYITGLEQDRSRTSDSTFVSKVRVRERAYDDNGQEYLNTQGKNYTVERLHPSPYTLSFSVDIWSTNTDQKLQILEQLLVLFNPSLEIQTTDNYIDWTSLSTVSLERQDWSNRSIPIGTESEIDIATLYLTTPIYISAPAKIKKLGVITKIIANIWNESSGEIDLGQSMPELSAYSDTLHPTENYTTTKVNEAGEVEIETYNREDTTLFDRTTLISTHNNYGLYVEGNVGKIVDGNEVGKVSWRSLIELYPGEYAANVSQVRIRKTGTELFSVGTITINPLDDTLVNINWDNDTLPNNDIIEGPARNINSWTSIDYVIEPERYNPNTQKTSGLRLLILNNINPSVSIGDSVYDGPDAWKNSNGTDFVASTNDVIEWDGTNWHVVFDAGAATNITYIQNLNTGIQYKWTGEAWIKSWEGYYSNGNWLLKLNV